MTCVHQIAQALLVWLAWPVLVVFVALVFAWALQALGVWQKDEPKG